MWKMGGDRLQPLEHIYAWRMEISDVAVCPFRLPTVEDTYEVDDGMGNQLTTHQPGCNNPTSRHEALASLTHT
jgi:hypothetical protein